ncbi:MAG: reverse transcriptase family protein, partial [Microcoleus sp. Co-bin12]|nr:reverse transcriptase family protein [Microcoleus sp. Co-bin12]
MKKSDKPDYTVPKAYRIITLLNTLGKISEKIIATRLSYMEQISDLLDFDQMGDRKNHSAIDAVLNLIHDIELSLKSKNVTSCLFMNIKGAFDYVAINQLLNIMNQLKLPNQIVNWVEKFMTNRSIELKFDGKKSSNRQIRTGIPQGSPISPILFLIYIRFLFPKLRIDGLINSSSFCDDIQISTSSKSIATNCRILTNAAQVAFQWAGENTVKFDDDKSELIHFESKRSKSTHTITLPNGTILKPQKMIKWLGIWIDRKLTFKPHVEKRIASATRIIHSIHRLQNSEWGLSSMAGRQLYMT